jgi:hypothetical protein
MHLGGSFGCVFTQHVIENSLLILNVFCKQWSAMTTSYRNSSLELGLDLEKLGIAATIVNPKSLRLITCSLNFIGPICHIKTLKHIHIVIMFVF